MNRIESNRWRVKNSQADNFRYVGPNVDEFNEYLHLTMSKTSRLVGFATRLSAIQRKLPTSSRRAFFICKYDVPLTNVTLVFSFIS